MSTRLVAAAPPCSWTLGADHAPAPLFRSRSRDKAVDGEPSSPRKRRKIQSADEKDEAERLLREWQAFGAAVDEFDVQHVKTGGRFMFSYVEGPLVKALRNGDWCVSSPSSLRSESARG